MIEQFKEEKKIIFRRIYETILILNTYLSKLERDRRTEISLLLPFVWFFYFLCVRKILYKKKKEFKISEIRETWPKWDWHGTKLRRVRLERKGTNTWQTELKDDKIKKEVTGRIQLIIIKFTVYCRWQVYINPNNDDWLAYIIGRAAGWGTAS